MGSRLSELESILLELEHDFEGASLAIESEVAAARDPTVVLDVIAAIVEPSGPDRSGTNEASRLAQRVALARDVEVGLVPRVVEALLHKSFPVACVTRVNEFYQLALRVAAQRLKHGDYLTTIPTLVSILDSHSPFYLYHTHREASASSSRANVDHEGDERDRVDEGGSDLHLQNRHPRVVSTGRAAYSSRYFVANLEYWGDIGGFTLFVELLGDTADSVDVSSEYQIDHDTNRTDKPSFHEVQNILRLMYNVKDYLHSSFLLNLLGPFTGAVRSWVAAVEPDKLCTASRESLLELVHVLELLLIQAQQQAILIDERAANSPDCDSVSTSGEDIECALHLLRLDIYYAFFTSSSLEKRIYGFTEIVVLMTRMYNDQVHQQDEPTADTLRSALSFLLTWMTDKRLMEELFGAKLHVELVKRSTPLFQFASELEALTPAILDLVWRCYYGKSSDDGASENESAPPTAPQHEALRTLMHELLIEIADFVDLELLNHLVGRVECVKPRDFDETHLSLLCAMARRKMQVADEMVVITVLPLQERVLLHLWVSVLPFLDRPELQELVIQHMAGVMREGSLSDESGDEENQESDVVKSCASVPPANLALVERFLLMTIENISQRAMLSLSLQLIIHLAQVIQDRPGHIFQRLSSQTSNVEIILKELVAYKRNIRLTLEMHEPDWNCLADSDLRALPLLDGCVDGIKVRLYALRGAWKIDNACGCLSPFGVSEMEMVWNLLVSDCILEDESSLCFQWIKFCSATPLAGASDTRDRQLLPPEVSQYLLSTKFPVLPGDRISLSALSCFHALFREVNLENGALESCAVDNSSVKGTALASSGNEAAVVDFVTFSNLIGLDGLWNIVMSAANPLVVEEGINLLVGYYLDCTPAQRGTHAAFLKKQEFIEKCLEQLKEAKYVGSTSSNSAPKPDSVITVNRCLDLLRYFLGACNDLETGTADKGNNIPYDGTVRGALHNHYGVKIDSLEERLEHLDVYPSPMKDACGPSVSMFGTTRRPSWTFRHHRPMLDIIVDENEDADERTEPTKATSTEQWTPRLSKASVEGDSAIACAAQLLQGTMLSVQFPSESDSSIRSPTLRQRVNLTGPQSPSPQRGPHPSADDISRVLKETKFGGAAQCQDDSNESRENHPGHSSPSKYGSMNHIIANEGSHFDCLLELVDWDEAVAQRTWELLSLLPTNNKLLRAMIQLRPSDANAAGDQVEWDGLLNSSKVYRLLYSLRLVEALLIPVDVDCADNIDQSGDLARRQWRERFVRLGGANRLYDALVHWSSLLLAQPVTTDTTAGLYSQNLRATCLAEVIRTLNYFFKLMWASDRGEARCSRTSEFDKRLFESTLPALLGSVNLPLLLETVMNLIVQCCCMREEVGSNGLSDEYEEVILVGVELCGSLIAIRPGLVWSILADGSSTLHTPTALAKSWLEALLLECPRLSTRSKALVELVQIADTHTTRGDSSTPIADIMSDACCSIFLQSTSQSSSGKDHDQLVALCCLLVRRLGCASPFRDENLGLWAPSRTADTMLANFNTCVSSILEHRQEEHSLLACFLELLTTLVESSEGWRSYILHWTPASMAKESGTTPKNDGEWMVQLLMEKFVLAGVSVGGASTDIARNCASTNLSSPVRSLAQNLLAQLVLRIGSTTHDESSQDISLASSVAIEMIIRYQQQFQDEVCAAINSRGRPWNYSPQDSLQDVAGGIHHAGLVNPGCVCYMNSLLQQLCMMPDFYNGLLQLDCSSTGAMAPEDTWCDEVNELQRLFVSLGYSKLRSCDPTTFALSHRDLDGNPTDLRAQMDADEFFCLLLDRLETFISSSTACEDHSQTPTSGVSIDEPPARFLDKCFGGVLVNQILTENGHLSEREERFFALSLEIAKKRHLNDSLALYVESEPLEGENAYFCERVQRKVSAIKRIRIKTLPRTLVCHLKRFEFDFDTMEKMKINDFLEFPFELDMSPYTCDSLQKSVSDDELSASCMYDLVGVVVHSGMSETGHYYSFIKERTRGSREESDKWLEFNDEIVRELQEDMIGEECFGGEEVRQRWDPVQRTYVSTLDMKRRSAYMLIYERRETAAQSCDPGDPSSAVTFCSDVQQMIGSVIHDNTQIDRIVRAFGDLYEEFVLLTSYQLASGLADDRVRRQTYQCACQYLYGIYSLSSRCDTPSDLYRNMVDAIILWLSTASNGDSNQLDHCSGTERAEFSMWLLQQATTTLPSSTMSNSSSDECSRSWLFDAMFLSGSNMELASGLFRLLSCAVSILMHLVSSPAAVDGRVSSDKQSVIEVLTDFFRAVLNILYSRHHELIVRDPVSDGIATITSAAVQNALAHICELLETVCCTIPATMEASDVLDNYNSTLQLIFIDHLELVLRFVASLELMSDQHCFSGPNFSLSNVPPIDLNNGESLNGPQGAIQVQLSSLPTERRILLELLGWREQQTNEPTTSNNSAPPSAMDVSSDIHGRSDIGAALSRVNIKVLVLANCEDVLLLLVKDRVRAGNPSQCGRLMSQLVGVLEDVRTQHAKTLLDVIDLILDIVVANDGESDRHARCRAMFEQFFSPVDGLIEAAAYYKERELQRDHTYLLLRFTVRRAAKSGILRELFTDNLQWCHHVEWIVDWLVNYIDPRGEMRKATGDIRSLGISVSARRKMAADSDVAPLTASFDELLDEIDRAFGSLLEAGSAEAGSGKRDGTAEVDDEQTGDHSENQSDLAEQNSESVDWKSRTMARKDACVQEQPEGEDEDDAASHKEHSTTESANRIAPAHATRSDARVTPRLRLDLEYGHTNYSEA